MTLSDEMARGLLAQVPDLSGEAVLIVATDDAAFGARIVYANQALDALLGRPAGEILNEPFGVLRAAALDAAEFARLGGALQRGQPIELKMRIAQGARNHWVEVRGHPLQGERQPYLLRLRDLSRQRALTASARLLQQRFEALSGLTSDAIYFLRVGPDSRLALEWSAGAFERLTGYTAAEIERLGGWSALVEPADQRIVQRRAQRLLAGEDATAEYRIRTRNGESRWLYDLGRPQWDEPHELVVGVLCAARDVTALRALEERLRASEASWKALAGLAGGLVFRLDAEQRVVEVAGQAQGELGGRLRAAGGQRLSDPLGDALAEIWSRPIERAAAGSPVHFDFSHASTSGEESYRASLCASPDGTLLAVLRLSSLARQDLAPPEAAPGARPELAALLNLQPSAAVLLSPGLNVAELNAAAEHLTGWQRAAAQGRPFVELMAVASRQSDLAQDLERARQGAPVVGSEAWLRLPGGQEGRIVWNYTPLLDAAGGVVAILAQGQALAPLTETAPGTLDDQQRLRAIMDHVADGMVALDGRGAIVAFSGSAEVIFGYRRDEVLSRGAEIIVVQGPQASVMDLVIAASKEPRENRETLARRKGGEVFPIELAASDLTSSGDTLYILTVRDITLRKQTEETVRNLAYHDPLTGLPNRLLFNDRLSQAIERARRNRQTAAVMILDLDRFKLINDSLGMASGDRVLRAVGARLVATLRRSDTVARLGGDDFLLLLPAVEGAEAAAKVAHKLLDAVRPPLKIDSQELHIGASLGIALYPHDGEHAETLVRNADTALYRAKEHARGGYQFYTNDMNASAFERLVLETQLRKALERGELIVHYQPQVRLDTGRVVGVEALVRWFHGDLGLIPPAEFIPLAEETGLILELGRWVLGTACARMRAWQERGFGELRLAVNLSGRQFQQADLVRSIADAVSESGFDPRRLELELTESSIMQDPDEAVAKLRALDGLGIRLSIDDFGTGYSSLAHLKRFPIKTLKIDQSFIQDITTDASDAAIAQAIIALAASLRLRVIAEGVETWEQLELLRSLKCEEMQGYLFSRPLPDDELLALLERGDRLAH